MLVVGLVLLLLAAGPPLPGGTGVALCQAAAAPTPAAKGTISNYGAPRTPGHTRVGGVVDSARIANLTRQHGGDLFYAFGEFLMDSNTQTPLDFMAQI